MLVTEQPATAAVTKKLFSVEYLVISDKNSKVLLSTHDYIEAKSLSSKIVQAGGSSTVFKSIK
jgi:ABC-type nitrate/sulfonate/bicarbonate transport system ATPase subunit